YCTWLVGLVVAAWRALPRSASPGLPLLHAGAILFLFSMLVTALTIANFAVPPPAVLIATAAGLAAGHHGTSAGGLPSTS
ncbi:MAG: hypothetical protein IMF16_00300, partial [Proteobacteria bacterium]|nr:hypothetical protein [Pseudomonadota bacterium]